MEKCPGGSPGVIVGCEQPRGYVPGVERKPLDRGTGCWLADEESNDLSAKAGGQPQRAVLFAAEERDLLKPGLVGAVLRILAAMCEEYSVGT